MLSMLIHVCLIASGYVLMRGLEEGRRSRYELLLHCILIVTSVVPPDLPMQMVCAAWP